MKNEDWCNKYPDAPDKHEHAADVTHTLQNELEKLGIDITTEDGRADFRQTILWAKQNRQRCEKAATGLILVVVGGVLTVLGSWLMSGFHEWTQGIGPK